MSSLYERFNDIYYAFDAGNLPLLDVIEAVEKLKLEVKDESLWNRFNFTIRELRSPAPPGTDHNQHIRTALYSLHRQWDFPMSPFMDRDH